jgi:ribosomal protein S7
MKINNILFTNFTNLSYIYSDEYYHSLMQLMNQLDKESINISILSDDYLFNKIVGLSTKNGNKNMARLQVLNAFDLIKQFFRINASIFLKKAVLQVQTFIFLNKIPRGRKIRIYPRILPFRTRIFNALRIIVKEAFENSKSYKYFYISLAGTIIENSMPNNRYQQKTRETTALAELNKRNIRIFKKSSRKIITKIKRKERFKLFKKIHIKK